MSTLPPGAPRDPEPDYRIGLGMLLGIAALAAAAAVLAVLLITRHHHHSATARTAATTTATTPTTTATNATLVLPVPSLVGQQSGDASAGLRRAGFRVTLTGVQSTQPRGSVVQQDPRAGAHATKGSVVHLSVSTGAPTPTTTAQTTTAQTTTAETTTRPSTTTAPAQPTTAQVPSLSGNLQGAVQRLDQAGFRASIAYVPNTQPLGTVIAQTPSSGATAPHGSQVTVNVSAGPNASTQETVPDVTGKRVPEALAALNAAGLRLIELKAPITDQSHAGVIVAQSPLPGKHAPKNAQVLVYWGAFQR